MPPFTDADLLLQFSQIRLLALDVDGVLTDGGLYYTETGEELKKFNVKDGLGLKQVMQIGIEVAIITTSASPAVGYRAEKLGIPHVFLGTEDKLAVLTRLCQRLAIPLGQVAYMGDDLVDIPAMEAVGLPITVPDAAVATRGFAHFTTSLAGGQGAVRQVCDLLVGSRANF